MKTPEKTDSQLAHLLPDEPLPPAFTHQVMQAIAASQAAPARVAPARIWQSGLFWMALGIALVPLLVMLVWSNPSTAPTPEWLTPQLHTWKPFVSRLMWGSLSVFVLLLLEYALSRRREPAPLL